MQLVWDNSVLRWDNSVLSQAKGWADFASKNWALTPNESVSSRLLLPGNRLCATCTQFMALVGMQEESIFIVSCSLEHSDNQASRVCPRQPTFPCASIRLRPLAVAWQTLHTRNLDDLAEDAASLPEDQDTQQ